MKPYLEVKVVKVKKEKKLKTNYSARLQELKKMMKIPTFMCYVPDIVFELAEECRNELSKPKKKGNWVNGENLDKIKFPCFCSFKNLGRKCYGMINKDFKDDLITHSYNLVEVGEQAYCVNAIWDYDSLEDLFNRRNIHILKGKIILFEEE